MTQWSALAGVVLFVVALPTMAQVPVPAATTLNVALDQESATIELGSETTVPITLSFSSAGFVCPTAGEATVNLGLEDSGLPGVSGKIEPGTIRFPVPAGAYVTTPFTASGASALTVTVTKNSLPSHDHSFTVTASYDGNAPQGCTAIGTPQSAEDAAEFKIKTGALPTSASDIGSPTGPGAASSGAPTTKGTPGVAPVLLLLGLAGIALLARHRRH